MRIKTFIASIISILFIISDGYAANIYVDKKLKRNIANGTYSIAKRNGSGNAGNAYTTVQAAINAMSPGDHIYLRGGTYQEGHIQIPPSKNGTSWKKGKYNKICSFPGEWAVLDGQNNCSQGKGEEGPGVVLGFCYWEFSDIASLKYWHFERIEIKNGSNRAGTFAAGFWGGGGPFKFRFLYIHDNVATYAGNNPAGLKGHHWRDSLVEYCYFNNNGMAYGTDNNPANILIYGDYNVEQTAFNGFKDDDPAHLPNKRNIIRYNLFVGSSVGFKNKGPQIFSGRNADGGHGWDDTYNKYGNKIHHNIFKKARVCAIGANQDFSQVYNNIIDSCSQGIAVQHEPLLQLYKVVIYNNTIINPAQFALIRFKNKPHPIEEARHYGWDFNNIIDRGRSYSGWCHSDSLTVCPNGSSACGIQSYDLSAYYCSNNYFYRPGNRGVIRLGSNSYSASAFSKQTLTAPPRIAYTNRYSSKNPLYKGTKNADKYKTRGNHVLKGKNILANAGFGGPHPYLDGVKIPSYIGATDPKDNGWVDIVLDLVNLPTLDTKGLAAVSKSSK